MTTKAVKFKNIKLGMLIPHGDIFYKANYIRQNYKAGQVERVSITSNYIKGHSESPFRETEKWEGNSDETLYIEEESEDEESED